MLHTLLHKFTTPSANTSKMKPKKLIHGCQHLPAAASRVPHVNPWRGCVGSLCDGIVHSNLASIYLNPIALLLGLTTHAERDKLD